MLGATLWLTLAMGLLAGLALDAAAAFGHAGLRAASDHAIESAQHAALADFQNRFASALAALPPDGDPAARYAQALARLPNPVGGEVPASGAGPGLHPAATYGVTATTVAAPDCAAGPAAGAPPGADVVGELQCHPAVAESRISIAVAVRVVDPGGATLAQRTQSVTLRLFAEPPYSVVAGRQDDGAAIAAGDAATAPGHEGDVDGAAAGTLIRVRYACSDGAGSCANAAPPDPDDLRAGAGWQNGNHPLP